MFYTGPESMGVYWVWFLSFVCFYDIIKLIAHIYAAWGSIRVTYVLAFLFCCLSLLSWFLKKIAGQKGVD